MNIVGKEPTEEKITFPLIKKQNVVKITIEKKDKEFVDMDSLKRLIKTLWNDIIDLKKNLGESSSYRRPWKPPFRRSSPPLNSPNTSHEEIHIEDFAQYHYY